MNIYDFIIADIRIRVKCFFKIPDHHELQEFHLETDLAQPADVEYRISVLPQNWTKQGRLVARATGTEIYELEEAFHRYYYWSVGDKQRYVVLVVPKASVTHYEILLQEKDLSILLPRFRLAAFLSMEYVMMRYRAFQLHASVIEWQGRGILFSAPSGTGKSTQADLWNRFENAGIINGDRATLRRIGDQFMVYGSPYAGTSGIYRNVSVPVHAVVILSQGPENVIERLSVLEAFRKLYRECTVPMWNPSLSEQLLEEVLGFAEQVPAFHLSCRPDRGAVDVLKAELEKL